MSFERIVLPNRTANIRVAYSKNFPLDSRSAVQAAVDIWATLVVSPITIIITANWGNAPNAIAEARSSQFEQNFDNVPLKNIAYPIALANALAGRDLDSKADDINIDVNPNQSQSDLTTIILHEIAHGLGFSSGIEIQESTPPMPSDPVFQEDPPRIYSQFIRNSSGHFLADTTLFPDGSAALRAELISNDLFGSAFM